MRVSALMAGLVPGLIPSLILSAGLLSGLGLAAAPAMAEQAKPACSCNCPAAPKIKASHAQTRRLPDRHAHYSYRDAPPVHWGAAPNGAYLPGPAVAYVEPEGLLIDQRGWTGGVGYGEEGGGGGGYGQVLLANGNSQNGPTYNSFGESFQQNPSMARPFQSRLMGGLAPAK